MNTGAEAVETALKVHLLFFLFFTSIPSLCAPAPLTMLFCSFFLLLSLGFLDCSTLLLLIPLLFTSRDDSPISIFVFRFLLLIIGGKAMGVGEERHSESTG